LALLALRKFGRKGWERFDELLSRGEITVEQCVAEQYAAIEAETRKEVTDYIDGYCRFRPGFTNLLSECKRQGVGFTVVSAGLDFCIRHAFRRAGATMPKLVCPKSSLAAGKGFSLSFPRHRCAEAKDFKEDVVMRLRKQGDNVVFIGDGAGDFNAAARADFPFAVEGSPLGLMLADRGIPYKSVRTLTPVAKFVHRRGRP